jgi:hypothetical protein
VADWHYHNGSENLAHTGYHDALDGSDDLGAAEVTRAAEGLVRTTHDPCHTLPLVRHAHWRVHEELDRLLDGLRARCR